MQQCKTWLSLLLIGGFTILLAPRQVSAQTPREGEQKQAEGEDVQKQAEEAKRARDIFLREERVLFGRGELQLEFGTLYSLETREQFVRINDDFQLAKITVRSVTPTLTARYSLLDNLEINVSIPFSAAESELDIGIRRFQTDEQGLGDINGAVRYQVWHEQGARPDVILDLTGKSRTGDKTLLGTGHWNVGGGITLVKTLDPVVFFGRVGYTYTLEEKGSDPGNEISYRIGLGFSLNDRVSLNMQVLGAYVGRAEFEGRKVAGSSLDIISLQFGVTGLVSKRLFIEPVVGFGLTDAAADVVVGVSVPFQF